MKRIWRLSTVLLVLMSMLTAFSSCTNDEGAFEGGKNFNISGTSIVGTWAYVDEDDYDGELYAKYYFTLTSEGLLTYWQYWGEAIYKDGYIYSHITAESQVRYHCVLKGNGLYTDNGLLLTRIKIIDSNTIRTFDRTYGDETEDYIRVKGFELMHDYRM